MKVTKTGTEKAIEFVNSNPEAVREFWNKAGGSPSEKAEEALRKGSHPPNTAPVGIPNLNSPEHAVKTSRNSEDANTQPEDRPNHESTENVRDGKDSDPLVKGLKSLTDRIKSLLPLQ